jgi:hypothetical protein
MTKLLTPAPDNVANIRSAATALQQLVKGSTSQITGSAAAGTRLPGDTATVVLQLPNFDTAKHQQLFSDLETQLQTSKSGFAAVVRKGACLFCTYNSTNLRVVSAAKTLLVRWSY